MNYVNDEKTLANFADNDKFYSDRMENRISPESSLWNPWHGCHKLSTGCRHCYVYRGDSKHGKDSSIITKTGQFNLPVRRKKDKTYKIPSGNLVYTCFTSDFLYIADECPIPSHNYIYALLCPILHLPQSVLPMYRVLP